MSDAKAEARVLPVWPDTGRALGLSRSATYEAIKRGEIPCLRFGRKIVVSKIALDRLLTGETGKAA